MTNKQEKLETVIFGPFVGEFGWETMHWMGFVNNLCSTKFKNSRKIVISYPGRSVLYKYADEVIAIPQWFIALNPSARNYILDGWIQGYPGDSTLKYKWNFKFAFTKLLNFQKPHRIMEEKPYAWPDMKVNAEKVLSEIISELDLENFTLICPWKINSLDGTSYGFDDSGKARYLSQERNIHRFPNPDHEWSYIESTQSGKRFLSVLHDGDSELITIFPRRRLIRRQDKNWKYEKYQELIRLLSETYPEFRIALCGEPGGAYFERSVPENCIDLINIDPATRLDAHLAALEKSRIAIGSLSGAMFLPLMTLTPTLVFGIESEKSRFERDNYLNAKLRYLVSADPSIEEVLEEVDRLISVSEKRKQND